MDQFNLRDRGVVALHCHSSLPMFCVRYIMLGIPKLHISSARPFVLSTFDFAAFKSQYG